jgi:hypothetical protein
MRRLSRLLSKTNPPAPYLIRAHHAAKTGSTHCNQRQNCIQQQAVNDTSTVLTLSQGATFSPPYTTSLSLITIIVLLHHVAASLVAYYSASTMATHCQ